MTYHLLVTKVARWVSHDLSPVSNKSNKMGVTSGAEIAYPSEPREFAPGF